MLYFLMEVLGDNIQRDEAKRNRAEEGITSGIAGGKMRGWLLLGLINRTLYLCGLLKFVLLDGATK